MKEDIAIQQWLHSNASTVWNCRSNAGLAAHTRACSVSNAAVTHAPEPLSIFCCPHCHLIFAAQYSFYTHLRTHHRNSKVSWCSVNHIAVTHAPEPLSIFCCPHCQMNFATQHRLYENTPQKFCFLVLTFLFLLVGPSHSHRWYRWTALYIFLWLVFFVFFRTLVLHKNGLF